VYRLAGGSLRYRPPVSQTIPPCARAGEHVTFGLFQRAIKYSRATWDCISGALRATPGSRLLVHNGDPELNVDGSPLRRRILDELSARDIEASRVSFAGGLGLHAHLALIGSVDVALDTYPYSGQTTAMECLWMGVPIVSRRGSLHASRVSGALMAQVGLEKYVGDDEEGYVRAATLLTADVDELRRIRRDLRSRMIDAGLTDGARLAREVEQAFESWVDVRDR
jgi:protein O-GlcNAc transferase